MVVNQQGPSSSIPLYLELLHYYLLSSLDFRKKFEFEKRIPQPKKKKEEEEEYENHQ